MFFCACVRADHFTINIVETTQGHTEQAILENILMELYATIDIIPQLVYYPSKRGLLLVDQGVLDAEAARYELAAQNYPNLIKVDVPLNLFHSGFYCLRKKDCELSANTNIVALSSFQSAPSFCGSMKLTCSFESNPITIIRMLEKGIAQGFLSSTFESNKVICQMKGDKLYYQNQPTLARFSYHFVNKNHALLVPKLEHSLRQIKQTGLLTAAELYDMPTHVTCGKQIIVI